MGATALGTFQRAMTGKDEKGNPLSPSSKVTTAGIKAAEHILRKLGAIGDEGPAVSINVKQARVVRYNPAGSSDPETDDAE